MKCNTRSAGYRLTVSQQEEWPALCAQSAFTPDSKCKDDGSKVNAKVHKTYSSTPPGSSPHQIISAHQITADIGHVCQ
uniref:Uncharacterized protein n=1 Tax=Anguilla anguilla TaxID=7936 RepID=A0A0E9X1Q5_ANGAN